MKLGVGVLARELVLVFVVLGCFGSYGRAEKVWY